jgi:hypothetical protein
MIKHPYKRAGSLRLLQAVCALPWQPYRPLLLDSLARNQATYHHHGRLEQLQTLQHLLIRLLRLLIHTLLLLRLLLLLVLLLLPLWRRAAAVVPAHHGADACSWTLGSFWPLLLFSHL